MHYAIAMHLLKGQRTAVRASVPENRLVRRFGAEQRLNPDPLGRPTYITWTPTAEDMHAEDWHVHEDDGTPVPPPSTAAGTAAGDPPTTATGGTGTGTGWRRA